MADSFFQSEIVQSCLEDIMVLQHEVMLYTQYGMYATIQEQRDNVRTLRVLLSKQKNMFLRCSLSDSPAAKELQVEILKHFEKFGHIVPENPIDIFDLMSMDIDEIEESINEFERSGE